MTITDLITHFFRSLSNSESCLKDFRREGELAFRKPKQSPHSGSSCAGTTLAHRQSATLCVLGAALMLHNLSNTWKNYTGYRRRKHHSSNGTLSRASLMALSLSHTQNNRMVWLGGSLEEGASRDHMPAKEPIGCNNFKQKSYQKYY